MALQFYLVLLYGLLTFAGGVIGYFKAGSMASLLMGSGFGVLLLISAWAILEGKSVGRYAALVFAILLACFFSYRFLMTMAFMPAGMFALISIGMILILFKPR